MKILNLEYIILLIGIIALATGILYFTGNYHNFRYGKHYNKQRSKLQIPPIPEAWYCTTKSEKQLRFSPTKKVKDLSIFLDSTGYKGHLEKFIFLENKHYEEDVFIEVKDQSTDFYRSFYYYDEHENKCTLNGNIKIDCSVIPILLEIVGNFLV